LDTSVFQHGGDAWDAAAEALRAGDVDTGVDKLREAASAFRAAAPKAAGMIGAHDLEGKLLNAADKLEALAEVLATGATVVPANLVSEATDAVEELGSAPAINPLVSPC
jgi:hypothetical protein